MSPYRDLDRPWKGDSSFIKIVLVINVSLIFALTIINLLILVEFNAVILYLQNSELLKGLAKINFDGIREIFEEIKISDIRELIGKVNEQTVIEFFQGIDTCIIRECH
jgi:hypothetical protein